jgi:hypothetical protein
MPLSAYAKDKFIAAEMSRFLTTLIQDATETSAVPDYWAKNSILNTILRLSMEAPQHHNRLRSAKSAGMNPTLGRRRRLVQQVQETRGVP